MESELPGMWDYSDFTRGWADTESERESMEPVVICTREELENIINELELICQKYGEVDITRPTVLRFAIDGGLKIKVNNYSWSRAYGEIEKL